MKKILNLVLVFVMSLAVVGMGLNAVQAAATEDVTITIHIHQFDGIYDNTGIGVWDGQNWNGWGALQSDVDEFGAVVVLNYTADEINAVGVDGDQIQFEITSNSVAGASGDDAAAQQANITPGDGKTFLDVSTLKDGSATELEVYYVQGATGFVPAAEGFGQIFVVYTDPTVAANATVYDAWNMWTWNNGTLGSVDGVDFSLDMVNNGGNYDIAMKLGVLNVAADADSDSGFIVRTEDWAKQCGSDVMIDNSTVRGSGTLVYYYQAESCELETDGLAYLADVDAKFEMNAGNRFLETNMITSPTTVEVELLMPQNPGAYDVSRFILKDSDGMEIPLMSAEASTMSMFGDFESDTVCAKDENKFILYVSSTLDHSLLGVVGSLQGWNPGAAVMSTKDSSNGMAVFEICTKQKAGEYKVLFDPDGDGFTWDGNVDPNVTASNQSFSFDGERMGYFYVDANVPTVSNDFVGSFESDFTPLEGEKTLIIHFETEEARDKISVVGAFVQGWAPDAETPYISTKDDTSGYAVFEVPTMDAVGEFKILFDEDDNGFNWGDIELTQQFAYDFGEETTLEIFINAAGDTTYIVGGTAVSTSLKTTKVTLTVAEGTLLNPGSDFFVDYKQLAIENHVKVFVDTDVDHDLLGLVGSVQGWDIANPITVKQRSTIGYAVFEFVTTEAAGEFKILWDSDGNGLNWGDAEVTPGDNVTFEMAGSKELVLFIEPTPTFDAGEFVSDFTPLEGEKTVIIHFDTDLLGSEISMVGAFVQEWAPDVATPYISTKVDEFGYAVFEVPTLLEEGEFKILHDADANGFAWGDAELTIQFAYNLNGQEVIEYFINASGDVMTMASGYNLPSIEGQVITDRYLGNTFTKYYAKQYVTEVVESIAIPFGTSNDFVPADVLNEMGTYAINKTEIALEFLNDPTSIMDSLLLFEDGVVIFPESIELANPGIGTYTETVICEATEIKLLVHVFLTSEVTNLSQLGLVGDIQGWDIGNTIPPVGMDSNGNYVFEVCIAEGTETGAFKVKLDPDSDGFVWDSEADPEMTTGDILFNFDGNTTTLYVEEGQSTHGTSVSHMMNLAFDLDVTKEYMLRFVDENGFVINYDLDIDNEAPELQASFVIDVVMELDQNATFDIMDYFTQLLFLDNRDGEMPYTITTDIDTSVAGVQTVVVSATDMWDNVGTGEFTFTVLDTVNPVITLSAAPTLEVGDTEPNWNSFVSVDEGTVVIDSSQVDMSAEGTYFVIFTATDAAGNISSDSLEITVDAAEVVEPEPTDDTGCFGSIGNNNTLLIFAAFAILGGATLYFIRKP